MRKLHVSRNTVRKVLRSGETEFSYERDVQPLPKLGRFQADLDQRLAANEAKPARDRLTLIRIFEGLRSEGYEGGYDAVRRYARSWQRERSSLSSAAFVPLIFEPGEAYQFDWSHEIVVINGVTVTVKVAHVRLCHSRMMFVRAYPRESQEMVFDAHDRAFAFFKGACTRGIYDNMKTAVDAIFVGKERAYNRRFLQMCSHFLVEPPPVPLAPVAFPCPAALVVRIRPEAPAPALTKAISWTCLVRFTSSACTSLCYHPRSVIGRWANMTRARSPMEPETSRCAHTTT